MANLTERRDKSGKLISYSIRVFRGRDASGKQLKPFTTSFTVEPTWTEKTARKKAEAFAATYERDCLSGVITDTRKKFSEYAEYVINLKESRGGKAKTSAAYADIARRVNKYIGHLQLKDIRADILNCMITELLKEPNGRAKCSTKIDLHEVLKKKKISKTSLISKSGLSEQAVNNAVRGDTVTLKTAEALCKVLSLKFEKTFTVADNATLSAKTVLEHHRFVHTVLTQACKEGLIPFNPADNCELPKAERKEPNYFQPETVAAIRDALESEPIKWRTLTHLLLITGCRRGEILGLKWSKVDFTNSRLFIDNNVLYLPGRGIYEDTPKTAKSIRYVSVPQETMTLLKQYKNWQTREILRLGEYYERNDFVFAQDSGKPMHPDSVTTWLSRFSVRHNLPHINPHAFRHTMASMLYFNGIDGISISKRLGHAQVSTTQDIYSHIIAEADAQSAELLGDIFLRKRA